MKFLKKNVKVIIIAVIGVIIGMLITGGIVFAAGQYNASEVRYDTTTVAGALDNLYNYAKNKSDLAEQMQKPNTWTVGTEYDFGDGVYGQRFTGTITADAGTNKFLTLSSVRTHDSIINFGGWFDPGDSERHGINYTLNGSSWNATANVVIYKGSGSNNLALWSCSSIARANSPYDVWILYTKTN